MEGYTPDNRQIVSLFQSEIESIGVDRDNWIQSINQSLNDLEKYGVSRWNHPGIPHKGWACTDMDDLEEPIGICGMCGNHGLRYMFEMHHPTYEETLFVGSTCTVKMVDEYIGTASELNRKCRVNNKQTSSEKRQLQEEAWFRGWKISSKGNSYKHLSHDTVIVMIRSSENKWFYVVNGIFSEKYLTLRDTKIAAFEQLVGAEE